MTRAILRRHRLAVKKRAEGAAPGPGAPPSGGRDSIERRTELWGYVRAADAGGWGRAARGAPERARWAWMACMARRSCTDQVLRPSQTSSLAT
jgi:hypothetical protein